jgi:hypothetical protein
VRKTSRNYNEIFRCLARFTFKDINSNVTTRAPRKRLPAMADASFS